MGKSQTKRFFHQDQPCEFDKLFIIWLFPSVLRAGNQPVGIVVEHYGKALQESNALQLANQSMYYIGSNTSHIRRGFIMLAHYVPTYITRKKKIDHLNFKLKYKGK